MALSSNIADKIIIALDGMDKQQALALVKNLPNLIWVKVGLELFVSSGPEILLELKEKGLKIFLDLKFHDIPVTMAGACRQAGSSGAELITVHASAGYKALVEAQWAALEGAADVGLPPPSLLAVTVLTSWDQRTMNEELLLNQSIQNRAEHLTQLAVKAGLAGCVCSPQELKILRHQHEEPFQLVTPGIRFKGSSLGDQVRVMTPSDAIKAGASKIVIGRPVTRALDPAQVFQRLADELE